MSFSCRLDGGGFSTCASPTTYTGLADGSHTFEAKARDSAGNEATASFTWTVDTTAPTAAVTFPASGATYNTSTYNADFCCTAADSGGAGVSSVEVSIRRGTGNYWNGSSFSSGSELFFAATGTTSWSYAFAAANFPADGSYTIRARTTDAAGNRDLGCVDLHDFGRHDRAAHSRDHKRARDHDEIHGRKLFVHRHRGGGDVRVRARRRRLLGLQQSTAHTWTVNSTMVCSAPGSQTVTANADTYIEEGSNNNFGTNADIRVVGSVDDKKARGLVRFSLPSVPSGCEVTSAALCLYASSAAGGRTLQAYRAASSWAETSGDRVTQVFNSRERGSNRPELIVTFG